VARLYLWCEGQTEQAFASRVLVPHLAQQCVYVAPPLLIAHARRRGRIHRGGGRKYLPMKNDIQRLLAQERGGDVFFTTMFDLYGIHPDMPGLAEAEAPRDPISRVELLEKCFAEDVGDSRFIPHIQLHELEAYLFADPECFGLHFERARRQIAALCAVADACGGPELIDDGPTTAPSKRIIEQFPEYEDAKVAIGSMLAECVGLERIRGRCPHFDRWVRRLEGLGRGGL
jgi:hypothetical protein